MTLADYSLIAHAIQLKGELIKTYLFKTNQYLELYNEYQIVFNNIYMLK